MKIRFYPVIPSGHFSASTNVNQRLIKLVVDLFSVSW
jgi:hypothetical protein